MQHFPRVVIDSNNNIHVACAARRQRLRLRYPLHEQRRRDLAGHPDPFAASMTSFPGWRPIRSATSPQPSPFWPSAGTDIWAYSLQPIKKVAMPVADFTFSPTTGYPPLTVGIHAVPAHGPNGSEVGYAWTFSDGRNGDRPQRHPPLQHARNVHDHPDDYRQPRPDGRDQQDDRGQENQPARPPQPQGDDHDELAVEEPEDHLQTLPGRSIPATSRPISRATRST